MAKEERKHRKGKSKAKAEIPHELTPEEKTTAEAQLKAEAEAALAASEGLLDDPHLMLRDAEGNSRIDEGLDASGLAGERNNAKQLYLAINSRITDRPVNISVEGPSAAGKTYLVEKVRALFPDDAVVYLSAGSERHLVYTDTVLRHKFIWVGESAGLNAKSTEGVGMTMWRELTWSGRLVYSTVEKVGNKMVGVQKVKEGPTGLIITGTKPPEEEMATRMLTITIRDDPKQTALVMDQTAKRYANG